MSVRMPQQRLVAGLQVTEWPGDGPTVLGLPGLGSSGSAWAPMAAALPQARLIAPDLRGRGASAGLPGPTGLLAHARDLKAIVDELGLREIVVAGHSMGAYLALVAAREIGDRVSRLVLVDGGIPPSLPFFMGPALTRLTFSRQLRKMDRDWPDVETMASKGGIDAMLASRPDLRPTVLTMLEAELGGSPGALRPRLDVSRAVADAVDTFFGSAARESLAQLAVPAEVFLAEHMKKDGQRPFIADRAVAPWVSKLPNLTVTRLPGNHVTVLFAPEVARAVDPAQLA